MSERFTPERVSFARGRQGLTQTRLAELVGVSKRTIANYESGSTPPPPEVVDRLGVVLDVPRSYFSADPIEVLPADAASFRALSKMTALKRNAALASGSLAIELNRWLEDRLYLPAPDVPRYERGSFDPASCARRVRDEWELGVARIRNVVHLLEAHGVRVFALPEHLVDVDAFSFWWQGTPYVLLNTRKGAERGRFDAAHELGHLVMHGDYDLPPGREREQEANRFAAALLMPEEDVLASGLRNAGVEDVIAGKARWGVSAAALAHRLHELGLTSDWTYHSTFRRLSQMGYRSGEPDSAELRETSQVLQKAFGLLRDGGVSQSDVARELHVRSSTLQTLLFGLVMTPMRGAAERTAGRGHLKAVPNRDSAT